MKHIFKNVLIATLVTTASVMAIGVNFGADQGPSPMAGKTYDGLSDWTDATGNTGSDLVVLGSGDAVTCDWNANNLWHSSPLSTDPADSLYYGYLDDGAGLLSISFSGLSAWLTSIGSPSYTVRVYMSTDDGGANFCDALVMDGVTTLDTIVFDPAVDKRSVKDSIALSVDSLTISTPGFGPSDRGSIAGVQITAIPEPATLGLLGLTLLLFFRRK